MATIASMVYRNSTAIIHTATTETMSKFLATAFVVGHRIVTTVVSWVMAGFKHRSCYCYCFVIATKRLFGSERTLVRSAVALGCSRWIAQGKGSSTVLEVVSSQWLLMQGKHHL